MSDGDRPLPRPSSTPFSRGRRGAGDADEQPTTVDRMAAASAEGRLEEFLDEELGGNEHAKALAAMVMGMSGLAMPAGAPPLPAGAVSAGAVSPGAAPPEDVARAVQAGDVGALAGLLRREQGLRSPGQASGPPPAADAEAGTPSAVPSAATPAAPAATAEREVLEQFVKIAAENDVSVDWLVLRAMKQYVADFRRTGRL